MMIYIDWAGWLAILSFLALAGYAGYALGFNLGYKRGLHEGAVNVRNVYRKVLKDNLEKMNRSFYGRR